VVVLGAGPAGLTAAAELARRGHAVTVLDERPEPGGLARYAIAPFRIRRQPLPAEVEQLQQLGVHIVLNRPISTTSELAKLERECDAVVLAVGMGPDTAVEYPNQGLEGVWESLQFIEQLKRGRPPRVGRQVVVIGGGNTAVDVAREAIRLGARRATIAYRRTEAEMPAYRHEIAEARAEGVEIQFLVNPVRMLGTDRVTGVECQRMRLGYPDASGRPRPEPVPGEVFTLPADTVVKAIGQAPRLQLFREVGGLDPTSALEAAHWVARHETAVLKAWSRLTAWDRIHRHLQRQRQRDPTDPHLTPSGGIRGGDRGVAAHFLTCEGRPRPETVRLVALAHGAPWIGAARKESYGKG
jgi:glutamate synthase (NADPH/NADH) small chain